MRKYLALLLAGALALPAPSFAAGIRLQEIPTKGAVAFVRLPDGTYLPMAANANGEPIIQGSFSGSVSGFTQTPAYANLTATGSSARVALPTGTTFLAYNLGTTAVSCTSGNSGVTAVADEDQIQPGSVGVFVVGAATHFACIDQTGSASNKVVLSGGSGLPTGWGGGTSSGGGGGAATIADGADVTQGAKADAKSTATDTTPISIVSILKQISASIQAAASSLSGTLTVASHAVTTIDGGNVVLGAKADAKSTATDTTSITMMQVLKQVSASVQAMATSLAGTLTVATHAVTQSGSWVLSAGSAIIGKFGIDQTTPGTTNGVYVTNNGVAQGAAIAGQTPSTIAAQTLAANPTAYTPATTNPLTQDEYGALLTHPYSLAAGLVKGTTSAMTGTTSTSLVAAPGAGLKNYITTLSCVNSHATVGTFVTVQDGSGGPAIWTVAAAALFGGTAITFPAPLQQPTANTALFVADVTTGANVICSASGYKAP